MEQASAIYDPMIPMGWIGSEPADRDLAWQLGSPVPPKWDDIVVSRRLSCGIAVTAQRRGFTIYDFAAWSPGVPSRAASRPGRPALRTLGDSSRAAKPALVQRLRVINTHLTLLHAAAMTLAGESPTVTRVGERDLFRHDVDDAGDDYWSQPLGAGVAAVVTVMDRNRFGVMPAATFDAALAWLDDVVTAGALVEFDLLNQTQAAVSTHDYALAVVAGWTVCELRIRALTAALPGIAARAGAGTVLTELERAGRLPPPLVARLHTIRDRRNAWLHSGVEPDEAQAIEAMQLGVELLRAVVPSLTLRPTSSLLIL